MKICIISEGCYPYVVGGVSSWIQQLITVFPQYEFEIFSIGADSSEKGNYAYKMPVNVTGITEIFLNDVFDEVSTGAKVSAEKWEIEEMQKLMYGNVQKWEYIFNFFALKNCAVSDFLMSEHFFEIAKGVYNNGYEKTLYLDFLWTLRSMYLTLFYVLNQKMPKADLYHSVSTGYAGVAGSMAKYFYGKPFIITEHGIYTREREEEIIKADWVQGYFKNLWINFFMSMSKCAYLYADRIFALFDTNRQIQIEIGAPAAKTKVIANGINIKAFEGLIQKDPDEKYLNVGALIRVTPIKDIKTMLYTFDVVKRNVPNARFYIMGPTNEAPEYYDECVALLNELGTKDVIFTGRINTKEYIGKMDVMVLTSISEGQPLSLMEAMASGKACVATNVGCCSELLNGKENDGYGPCGLIAPVMNYEKIAEAIIKILSDEKLRKEMEQNARGRISQYYTEEIFKENYKIQYNYYDNK